VSGSNVSGNKRKAKKGNEGPMGKALRALHDELAKRPETAHAKKRSAGATAPAAPPEVQDEALLLHRLYAGVEPLDRSRGRIPRQPVERSAAAERAAKRGADDSRTEADAVQEHLRTLVEGGARFEVADDGHRVEGRRVDVPMDIVRTLRRGRFPVDARLDLHGMSVQEARAQVELFLRTMRARGERCVLIIHGKGEHSPLGIGLLRGEISAWLSQGTSSAHVAAFATAQNDDGGEGAVYVLIRR
jgi:DNA-nicking Smr family endonuclease